MMKTEDKSEVQLKTMTSRMDFYQFGKRNFDIELILYNIPNLKGETKDEMEIEMELILMNTLIQKHLGISTYELKCNFPEKYV